MFRPLSIVLLTAIVVWPAGTYAQGRGGGGGGRGGNGARGAQSAMTAPRSGLAQRGQRGSQPVRRTTEILVLPPLGYYGGSYDVFGSSAGYYPLGDWPAPILTTPIGSGGRSLYSDDSALVSEIGRLSRELEQLRATTQRPLAAPQPPPPAPANASAPMPQLPPSALTQPERFTPSTVLILRDGRRVETQNYAIVGETFWILDQGQSQKFPFTDIDVDASDKENRGRGIRFALKDK